MSKEIGSSVMQRGFDRREFLQNASGLFVTAGLAGGALSGCATTSLGSTAAKPMQREPLDLVRVGFVGVGGMGTGHVRNLLKIKGAQITAVCDIVESHAARAQKLVEEAGFAKPTSYCRGETDFVRMCETEDLDLVYTATPWRWHVPVCVAAMENGKHAATEVPMAYTVDDCWKLVEMSEKAGLHCIMMENCCYDRFELLLLNMVKKGLFGEIQHAECGYLHDLRGVKFSSGGEGLWRRAHSINRDGDLYPTHGIGPIAQCMDINRGNQFDYVVSMSCNARGLHDYALERFGEASPQAQEKYRLGDVVTTLIKTKNGQTIVLQHDTNLPRPYSRDILVQGTKGIARKYPTEQIHIEGAGKGHGWEEAGVYYDKCEHPLVKALREKAQGAGHGGMDFIEDYRLINALLKGIEPDMDVYDGAAWSVLGPVSETSIAKGSQPVTVPDFTRGLWQKKRELQVMDTVTY